MDKKEAIERARGLAKIRINWMNATEVHRELNKLFKEFNLTWEEIMEGGEPNV